MLELVSIADVVIENYSARVMGNLRLDYDDLKKVRPDLIMISMPSFGRSGPYRDYVCFGEALEGMTGLSNLTGLPDGPPVRSCWGVHGPGVGDVGGVCGAGCFGEETADGPRGSDGPVSAGGLHRPAG